MTPQRFTYQQYINDVLSGKLITGELIKLAVRRHTEDLAKQNTTEFPYYFDEGEGQRWIRFAHKCKHWKGEVAKETIELEPHQQFYFMLLFGWQRVTGGRRFRTSYKEVARKNGKTTECAVKAIGHLFLDNESGAQTYLAATKEDQARIAFKDVVEIIKTSPALKKYYQVYVKSVVLGNSFIKPLGSDSNTQDGFDPSYGIIDEYHAHPTSGMLNVLESGMGARKQPLIDIITTAGFNRQSPCYSEVRKTSIEVLKGIKKDETHLALIYTLDEGDDWNDETLWIKSNPNLGVSVRMDFLRDRYLKAKNEGGSKEVDFKTKNLNLWTDSERTWIPDEVWMLGNKGALPREGSSCYGGLDLASTRDICALVLIFPTANGYELLPFFFIPELSAKERTSKDGVNYDRWVREGFIIQTPGNVTDYGYIRQKVNELRQVYKIQSIAYDRYNASQLVIDMTGDGVKCNPMGQGFVSMSTPTKEMEKLVYEGKINHSGNPVLRWMISNVMIAQDAAGNIKVAKDKSTEKVDGVVASIMALGELMTNIKGPSPYNERGILTL
jgi:phage terminase large subunit-like protein